MTASHAPSTKTYLAIWGWLTGLMLLGVFIAELPISRSTVVLVVLGLSTIKALLVALYFMHLKTDQKLLTVIAVIPLALVALALCVFFSSTLVRL